jgi:hypothetical protein
LALAFGSGHEVVVQAAEGDLDPTFGTGGKVVMYIGVFERVATRAQFLIDVRREERTRLASLNFLRSEDGRGDAEIAAHIRRPAVYCLVVGFDRRRKRVFPGPAHQ